MELERHAVDGAIGTAHPLLFQDVSPSGSWCLFCQARTDTNGDGKIELSVGHHGELTGDDASPYLVAGTGQGFEIDEFVSSDPSGRYVAFRRGACLEIADVDARPPTITTLPDADLRDGGIFGPHRGAAFDPRHARMLYLRGGETSQLVLRDLATQREETIDRQPGLILHAGFDPEGRWAETVVITSGEWPAVSTTLARRQCRGQAASYSTFGRGRQPKQGRRFLDLDTKTVYEGHDLVSPFGRDVLRRASDGALVVVTPEGNATTLVPAECNAHLFHADPARRNVIVSCGDDDQAPDANAWLFRPDGAFALPHHLRPRGDRWTEPPARIVQLGSVYVDMDEMRLVSPPPLASAEVRLSRGYAPQEGVYAERGDGMVLRAEGFDANATGEPRGPLRWRPAIGR
jgi:hypothetical protein